MILIRDEDGAALVEVSLILPLFILVFLFGTDAALIVQRMLRVADAATVGARYGTIAGNGKDLAGMQNAATAAANGLPGFSATASTYCACSPGGSSTSCASTCAGQSTPVQYVKVSTLATASIMFKVLGYSGTFPIASTATMRVAWGQ